MASDRKPVRAVVPAAPDVPDPLCSDCPSQSVQIGYRSEGVLELLRCYRQFSSFGSTSLSLNYNLVDRLQLGAWDLRGTMGKVHAGS